MNPALFVALLGAAQVGAAADESGLSLRGAIERALAVAPAAVRAEAEIAAARANKDQTFSLVLPRIAATGSLIKNSEEVSFGSPEERRLILAGTDWNARVTLQQPVYAGRRELRLYQQSKEGVNLALSGRSFARERLAFRVIQDYLALVQAKALVDVEKRGAELAARRVDQAQALFEAGEVTRVEVLRAETARKAAERRASLAEQEEIASASRLRVDLVLDATPAVFDPGDRGLPVISEDALLKVASARPEVLQAATNLTIAELEVMKQKGFSLPVVTADASYVWQRASFPTTRYGQAALRITVPIFQSGEVRARVKIAEERRRQAQTTLDEMKRGAREDIRQSVASLESARRTKALADEQLKAAEAEYAQARDLYAVREVTALDLEAAENALSEARRAVVQSRFAVWLAESLCHLSAGGLVRAALENPL